MDINKSMMLRVCGLTMFILSAAMIPSIICSYIENDLRMLRAFVIPAVIMFVFGVIILRFVDYNMMKFKIRDGYMGIFLVIFVGCVLGAIPYYIGINNSTFVDAIFESTAGLSTTSATVFYEPTMGNSLLLWKSIEHWIGGLFVLIFIISILPILGAGDQQIATAEAHGTLQNKIAPRSIVIIRYITAIYITLTVLAFIYFLFGNVGPFDAFILSMSTASTSGVLLYPEGISYYDSTYVEMGVSIFSILSSLNFVLYIHLIKKHFDETRKNVELRAFLLIIIIATTIIAFILFLSDNTKTLFVSFKDSFFQVTSFATTSGFALEDYTLWPAPCIFLLISLMLIGGCSASTTGSFKVIRLLIVMKLISRGITKRIHPRAVKAVKIGNSKISPQMVSSVTTFAILYFATLLFSIIILSLQNLDLQTTFSAALGMISNDGISFGQIGMSGEYGMFHPILKLYLCFLMIVGRLGLLTVFIVFLPSFWNPNKKVRIQ